MTTAGLAPIAGASPEADPPPPVGAGLPSAADAPGQGEPELKPERPHLGILAVATVFSAATIFFGIVPSPLFDFAGHAGQAIPGLF